MPITPNRQREGNQSSRLASNAQSLKQPNSKDNFKMSELQGGNDSKCSKVNVKIPVDEEQFDQFNASLTRIDEFKQMNNSSSDTLAFENLDYKTD